MKRNIDATLEYMQSRLVESVLKAQSMQDILDLSHRMAETAGIVAGTMIARRVKDCCPTCASPEGVAVTIHDMMYVFKSRLEEAARATAASIKTDEVAVFKGIQMHDNPPKDEPTPAAVKTRAHIDFVVDAGNNFVDVHDPEGKSFAAGVWVQLDGGLSALRVYPEVFGLQHAPEATQPPKDDPMQNAIARELEKMLGVKVHVVEAGSAIEAALAVQGVKLSREALAKLEAASAHHKTCRCQDCLLWWAYAGPDQVPGDYGPFTKDEVNAKQKVLKIEETE